MRPRPTAPEGSVTAPPLDARIFVAGHRGLVGSAIVRRLEARGYTQPADRRPRPARPARPGGGQLLVPANRPEYVFLVAGTVGGILANSTRPAEFLYDNMMIHATVVHASHLFDVEKLLYLGSSCIYPRDAAQPITEDELLTGAARADQRVLRPGQDRRHQAVPVVPPPVRLQLHLGHAHQPLRAERQLRPRRRSHVLPALMRKFHDAKVEGRRRGRRSGARARRGASSCTSTTWPTPASS